MKFFVVTILLAYVTNIALQAGTIELAGLEVAAINKATEDFKQKKYSTSGDLKHFTILLERHDKQVQIIFGPNDPAVHGPEDPDVGGSNRYGFEVHYWIDLKSCKIIKVEFAR